MLYVFLYVTLCPFLYCNHLDGEEKAGSLLNLSPWCLVMVERLFLTVPRGCLRFVNVVFTDHTHLLFLILIEDHLKLYMFYLEKRTILACNMLVELVDF